MKNWKTTLSAVALGVITILSALHLISPEQSTALMGALTAFGFALSKDYDKTGVN